MLPKKFSLKIEIFVTSRNLDQKSKYGSKKRNFRLKNYLVLIDCYNLSLKI